MGRTLDSYAEEADEARRLLKKMYETFFSELQHLFPDLHSEVKEFLDNEFDPNNQIGMPYRG